MAGSIINLNNTNPAPPSLALNVTWQKGATPTGTDPLTGYPIYPVSASVPYMVGDTGSGGTAGLVPPPPAGSAALAEFLRADGVWAQAVPVPAFVQGAATSVTGTSTAPSLSGVGGGHCLILHIRSGISSAPSIVSSSGSIYNLVHSVANSFWTTYTYTYICFAAPTGTETVTATFGGSSAISAILAEYTAAGGFESMADNSVGGNANASSTLAVASSRPYEKAIWFFSCNAFSGLAFNQTVQEQGAAGAITLMDATGISSGSLTGTVTSSAMNQPAMTGFFLTVFGSVSSVAITAPSILTVSGSPITSAGTIALGLATQAANLVFAGPTTGSAAAPTFRALVAADMPSGVGTVTSVSLSMPAEFAVAGSPVTSSGTLAVTKANQSINQVYAGPASGSPGAPGFRPIVAADLPLATTGAFGAVKPDGSTITILAGVISATGGSPLTTKGDLYGFSSANARIPVGLDTQILTADSSQALGVRWGYAPLVVLFSMSSGVTGTNVGPMLAAPRAGQITKCVVVTKSSDGSVGLSFLIRQNGTSVFSANPSVAAGTGSGVVSTVGTLTTSPLSISANDVFSIDILTGNGNWSFTAQLC